jgi:hypothetical protein
VPSGPRGVWDVIRILGHQDKNYDWHNFDLDAEVAQADKAGIDVRGQNPLGASRRLHNERAPDARAVPLGCAQHERHPFAGLGHPTARCIERSTNDIVARPTRVVTVQGLPNAVVRVNLEQPTVQTHEELAGSFLFLFF